MSEYVENPISREGSVLNVRLSAVLDKNNAPALQNAITESLDEQIRTVVFDALKLRTVTADGLDVILETKKKCRDVVIDHARIGLCDTLALYGFDRFLNIKKQYRFVSVKGCKVIGQGSHGTIYQIGEDTIVKAYRDHSALQVIENERQYARNAFLNGIPTAIAYDVVQTESGYGVIFEMINGMTMGKYLVLHPEKTEAYAEKFADLLHRLHTTPADPELYPDFHAVYLERAERTRDFLPEEDVEKFKRIIRSIPRKNGLVHGDYHPNNVMVDGAGELMLIDMADISRGNGFFDLGGSYLVMKWLAGIPILNLFTQRITGLKPHVNRQIWDILMRCYFGTEDAELLKEYDRRYRAFSKVRIAGSLGMNSSRSPLITRLMTWFVKHVVLAKSEEYISLFSEIE